MSSFLSVRLGPTALFLSPHSEILGHSTALESFLPFPHLRRSFSQESFCRSHIKPHKGERDRCGECGNSRPPFFQQLSQMGAGRVNRFAPRGLSQYADDMQQLSFFFPITQPGGRTPRKSLRSTRLVSERRRPCSNSAFFSP